MIIPQKQITRDWQADIGLQTFTTNLVDNSFSPTSTYYSAASLLNK